MRWLLCLAPALAIAAPAPAHWSPPVRVAPAPAHLADLSVAGDGTALASWRAERGWRLARRAPSESRWSAPCAAVRGELVGPVAYGGSRWALGARRGRRLLVATMRTARCTPSGLRRVASAEHRVVHPALAAGRGGHAALTWWEDRGTDNDHVRVALRRPGRRFSRPRTLARTAVRHTTAAVGPRGDVLVAWEARGRIEARIKPAGRARFGPVQTLRSRPTFGARPRAVIGPDGRAWLGWTAQRRSEGGDVGPAIVEVAVRAAGAERFGRAVTLERFEGRTIEEGRLELALDAAGTATAAWTGLDGIRVLANPERGPGPPQTVADATAVLGDLAVAPDGSALVAWAGSDPPQPVQGAHRPASGGFGPAEPLGQGGRPPRLAFDRVSGRTTALWSSADGLFAARHDSTAHAPG